MCGVESDLSEERCSCRNATDYPLNVDCKIKNMLYKATVDLEKKHQKYILDPQTVCSKIDTINIDALSG